MICWKSGAVDTLFPCGKGGGAGIAHEYKGKGVLIHLLVDADGMPLSVYSSPANGDERKHVGKLLETVAVKTGKAGRPRKNVRKLAADKGYDADALRSFLKKKGFSRRFHEKGMQSGSSSSDGKDCRIISMLFSLWCSVSFGFND